MRWKWLVAGVVICCGIGLLLGYFAVASLPKTYREAVIIVLERHQIEYRSVVVSELCKPDPGICIGSNFRISSAFVTVHTDRSHAGRIECRYYQSDCYLSLTTLRLHNESLPDILGVRTRPTPLDRLVEYIKSVLRVKTRRMTSRSGEI